MAPLLEAGVQAIVDRFKEFGDQVTAESRLTLEEISDRVLQDERLQYLFEAAGLAAIRTPMAQKRRALARVLAFALGDDAAIDDGQVLVPVIAELEAPHVRVLALLEDSRFEQGPGQDLEMASAQSGEELCQKWAPLGKIYEPVMGTLRRHVLIETNEITPFEFSRDVRWVLSEFGHRVLGYIREQGSA